MKFAVPILLTLFISTACVHGNTNNSNTQPKVESNNDTLTYLALGDSYTIGEAVPQAESFPYKLTARLKEKDLNVAEPQIIATTGWTTGDLIGAISFTELKPKYSFVTLLIGVNNQYQGLNADAYRKEFIQLLNTAIKFAKDGAPHVFVLSIPDYSVTPFAKNSDTNKIHTELENFNAINKEESARLHVNYIDITPISLQAANDASLLAEDGLHPSGKMYALWVEKLLPQVLEKVK